MKIFIDIYHLPQYNLYRNIIKKLGPEVVDLGCVNRGRLVDVIKKECPEFNLYVFGDYKYNNGTVSMGIRIILPRLISLFRLIRNKKYNVIATASYQANIIARLLGIPNFTIFDDPRKGILQVLQLVTDDCYLPSFSKEYRRIKKFKGLKEWAYLSPKYFKPDKTVLTEYGLKEKEYVFFREVSTDTSNYLNQEKNLILQLSQKIKYEIHVVLSLENKLLKEHFPKDWIILEEPVSDIHSLMYFSKTIVSSGDSMAREGAMLGVPSIYLGNRDMPANKVLMDKGFLQKLTLYETSEFINSKNESTNQEERRKLLLNEWSDINDLILGLINKYK